MITGAVSNSLQALIRVTIHGTGRATLEIEALIDTGYNGELTLPARDIEVLDLVWRRRGRALLADGSTSMFDTYEGFVTWDGSLRPIEVDAAETDPLVGMALLSGYELTIQAVPGGAVTITALS
jgi:clan AA aspartic protease